MALHFASMHQRAQREAQMIRLRNRAALVVAMTAAAILGFTVADAPARLAATLHQAEEQSSW